MRSVYKAVMTAVTRLIKVAATVGAECTLMVLQVMISAV
jgi:hypothetical protein